VNLRMTAAATAALLTLALAPVAEAKNVFVDDVFVCNTASQNWQGPEGDLVVSESDPQGALRYDDNLFPKKTNAGLINAAAHSRALAVCDGGTAGGTGGTGGGTGGGILIGV
jgi:hypothetical protein